MKVEINDSGNEHCSLYNKGLLLLLDILSLNFLFLTIPIEVYRTIFQTHEYMFNLSAIIVVLSVSVIPLSAVAFIIEKWSMGSFHYTFSIFTGILALSFFNLYQLYIFKPFSTLSDWDLILQILFILATFMLSIIARIFKNIVLSITGKDRDINIERRSIYLAIIIVSLIALVASGEMKLMIIANCVFSVALPLTQVKINRYFEMRRENDPEKFSNWFSSYLKSSSKLKKLTIHSRYFLVSMFFLGIFFSLFSSIYNQSFMTLFPNPELMISSPPNLIQYLSLSSVLGASVLFFFSYIFSKFLKEKKKKFFTPTIVTIIYLILSIVSVVSKPILAFNGLSWTIYVIIIHALFSAAVLFLFIQNYVLTNEEQQHYPEILISTIIPSFFIISIPLLVEIINLEAFFYGNLSFTVILLFFYILSQFLSRAKKKDVTIEKTT
ncbi:MAG: hypothetical protein ACTSVI_10630 [Promethearchaeota archaeon]